MKKHLSKSDVANACFFRTSTRRPHRKALIQITEQCNLSCAHCFVDAKRKGSMLSIQSFSDNVLPLLLDARVVSVSLTGGEPTAHPDISIFIELLSANSLDTTICTNGVFLPDELISLSRKLGRIKYNVSLDGFSEESHSKFRGVRNCFSRTVSNVRRLADNNLLKGILVTPNKNAGADEYENICSFAADVGAEFVLLNPLSSFGRGEKSRKKLEASQGMMRDIINLTAKFSDMIDVVYIRFPNDDRMLTACEAGNIIYVFSSGDVTVCPYLVFAARTANSRHDPKEFIVGNVFCDNDLSAKLDSYNYANLNRAPKICGACAKSNCGRGCPAAVVSGGLPLGELDTEMCPFSLVQGASLS
ncbi:MAG: radical SAM protein [Alphaproteobacteria bacterium]|nr:radical SAM protein [Alphaproteobacteria bacterium]